VDKAFHATIAGISNLPTMHALRQQRLLLQIKGLMFPGGIEELFVSFDRGDFKGYVAGTPERGQKVSMLIYHPGVGQFLNVDVRGNADVKLNEIYELLEEIQIKSTQAGSNSIRHTWNLTPFTL
jgi:hypothetical protein